MKIAAAIAAVLIDAMPASAEFLAAAEQDVLQEMNKVRANPKEYAQRYISPLLPDYDGKEGKAAIKECIAELSAHSGGLPALEASWGLTRAARAHAADQARTGAVGHGGSDGSDMQSRIKRQGELSGTYGIGENISYGYRTGRDIVIQLLIDDGVASRGHRKNILNADFTQTGIGFDAHPKYGAMCVIDYAYGFKDKQ
jgi:uncharacterized protein YkwD